MSLREQKKARAAAGILEAAQATIRKHGVAGASTREIAKLAGVSYQTLYNYFPTKGRLLYALLADEIDARRLAVDAAIKQYNGDLLATLQDINETALRRTRSDSREMWREVALQWFADDEQQTRSEALNPIAHERYHALLSMAQGVGELRQEIDLHLLAHTIVCLTDYALLRFYTLAQADDNALVQTLQEQLSMLLTPYLRRTGPGGD